MVTDPILISTGTIYTIRLYEPLTATNGVLRDPLDEFTFPSFGDQATLIQFQTERPGGYMTATIGVDQQPEQGPLPHSITLAQPRRRITPYAHVEILAGLTPVWEGFVREPIEDVRGDVHGFVANGYLGRANDRRLPETGPHVLTTGAALEMVRQRVLPYVRRGNDRQFVDPGIERDIEEFSQRFGGEVIDGLNRMGDRDGNPVDVMFWEGPTLWILPRIAPETADYKLELDHRVDVNGPDWDELYGRVIVTYTDAEGNEQEVIREDTDFENRFGFQRELPISAGRVSRAAADQLARVALRAHATERRSYSVNLTGTEGLHGINGGHTDAHLITSREWVERPDGLRMAIMSTNWDSMRQSGTLDISEQRPDWQRLMAKNQEKLSLLERGLNPVTGARV